VRPEDGEISQVRNRVDACRRADLRVGEGLFDGSEQVVYGTFESLDECRRDALRPGLDRDRRRLQVHPVGIRFAHPRVDVDQRLTMSVDRDLDLLSTGRAAVELPRGDRVQHHPEGVLAVSGEVVDDRHAAARAERRSLHVRELRGRTRNAIGGRPGGRIGIADRLAADTPGRTKVAFEDRCGDRLHVGDVVEVVADRIGWKERGNVHVDPEQIADRVSVFRAVQPLKCAVTGVRSRGGCRIEPGFQRFRERLQGLDVWTLRTRWRHHPRAQLLDHLLRDVRPELRPGGIERLQRQSAFFLVVVVTSQTVLFDQLAVRARQALRRGGGAGCWVLGAMC